MSKPSDATTQQRPIINPEYVHEFVESLFGDVEHAKRARAPYPLRWQLVEALDETERGEGGYGSTGRR